MKKAKAYIALLICAILCIGTAGVGRTSSYFTSRTEASGGYKVSDTRTEPDEEVGDLWKVIQIKNTGKVECYARLKVICGEAFTLEYSEYDSDWEQGTDGYWYYKEIIPAGGSSTAIKAALTGIPEDFDQKMLNIVVVTESVPVIYASKSGPEDWTNVDWSMAAPSWEMEVK